MDPILSHALALFAGVVVAVISLSTGSSTPSTSPTAPTSFMGVALTGLEKVIASTVTNALAKQVHEHSASLAPTPQNSTPAATK